MPTPLKQARGYRMYVLICLLGPCLICFFRNRDCHLRLLSVALFFLLFSLLCDQGVADYCCCCRCTYVDTYFNHYNLLLSPFHNIGSRPSLPASHPQNHTYLLLLLAAVKNDLAFLNSCTSLPPSIFLLSSLAVVVQRACLSSLCWPFSALYTGYRRSLLAIKDSPCLACLSRSFKDSFLQASSRISYQWFAPRSQPSLKPTYLTGSVACVSKVVTPQHITTTNPGGFPFCSRIRQTATASSVLTTRSCCCESYGSQGTTPYHICKHPIISSCCSRDSL